MRKSTVLKNDFRRRHYSVLIILALILIALAVFLLIWSVIAQIEVIELRYAEMQAMLAEWEYFIASLENKWLLILVLFLLYSLKCFVSVIPLSALFIISGMVFNVQYATAINIIGVAILVSIKFLWGDKFGGGSVSRVISRSGFVKDFLKLEGSGNPWMLFLARLVPFAPVNTVSRLYGASEIQYDKYLLLSLLGFAPRILSFSVLGNNVFDPFSVGFFGPIIIMLFLSGISILILDFALGLFGKRRRLSEIDKEERNNVI
ncbi:MAG: SNARE associated Golgi protein [Firmicutes bacterium ADurb.Bin300]|nr:MAG: SNARE associated Golgi protein [Firmicutes bacterium ADurb.Bin300]HOD01819.1 VTT domain-containing protein [Clostridiales bacterium]